MNPSFKLDKLETSFLIVYFGERDSKSQSFSGDDNGRLKMEVLPDSIFPAGEKTFSKKIKPACG